MLLNKLYFKSLKSAIFDGVTYMSNRSVIISSNSEYYWTILGSRHKPNIVNNIDIIDDYLYVGFLNGGFYRISLYDCTDFIINELKLIKSPYKVISSIYSTSRMIGLKHKVNLPKSLSTNTTHSVIQDFKLITVGDTCYAYYGDGFLSVLDGNNAAIKNENLLIINKINICISELI